MLAPFQLLKLGLLSVALWILATLYIRLYPSAMIDPVLGGLSFLTTFPLAWLSIVVIRASAGLHAGQLLAGVSVVGAVAMMIDGVVLHWWPSLYGQSETLVRLGAAWLLWGYGVSLGVALLIARGASTPSG